MSQKPTYEELEQRVQELEKAEVEHKRAEQKQLSSIFRSAPIGIGLVVNRKLKQVNSRLCEITGYNEGELINQSARILYPNDVEFEFVGREKYAQIMEHGTGTVETHWQRKDGTIIDVLLSSTPIDLQDHLKGVTFTVLNITERKRMEETLQESEHRFRELFDAGSDAILFIESDTGQILEANNRAAAMFGYSREELLTKKNWELSAEPEETQRKTQTQTSPDEIITVPLRYLRKKDGDVFPTELTGRSFFLQERSVFIAAFRDITDRKQIEDALREREEKYRTIVDQAAEGIVLVDTETLCFIEFNDAACSGLGYSREEFVGLTLFDVQGSLEKDEFIKRFKGVVKLGGGNFENRQRRKDGTLRDTIISNRVINLQDRKYVSGIWQDVTEQKLTEEALRESEDHYHSIFANSLIGITLTDKSFIFTDANDAFCQMLEYSREELVGKKTISDISHPDDVANTMEMIHKLIRHDIEHYTIEKRYVSKTGKIIQALVYVRGHYSPGGEYEGTTASSLDMTEIKKADELLLANQEKYRNLFYNSQIALFRSRLDGSETLDINKKFLDIVGKTGEEILGKPSEILWADPEEHKEMVRRLIADGNVSDFEFKMLHEQKGVRNCITSLTLYRDQGILEGSVADITERKQAEDELRQSQNLINDILETTPNLIYIYDLQEKFNVYSNSGLVDIIGYSSKEIKNFGDKLFAHILHPEDFAIVGAHHERLVSASEDHVQEVEYRLRHAKGHWVVLYSKDKPYLRDDHGKVKQIIGVAEDITKRQQAEKSLRESEEKFRTVASFIHNWEYWLDGNGNLAYVSPSCERITSYTAEEFYQDPELLTTIIHPDDRESFEQHVDDTAKGKTNEDCRAQDFRILTRNGEERWIAHVCRDVFDQEGNPNGRRVSNRGITERKQAEAELIEYSQRLQLATASGKLAIWNWNVKDNIVYWDDRMFELYGISRDTFPKTLDAWINGLHPDDKQRAIDESNAACLGEKKFNTVFRVLHPDGIIKHIKADAMVIRDQSGKAVRMIGINSDITEQVRAEEERQTLEAHLQQAQKMEAIGTLAGGIAHDFNNILGAILGYAEMAYEDSLSGSVNPSDLNQVVEASHRAKDLVKQILAFSRQAEAQKIPMRPVAMVKESIKLLRSSIPTTIDIQQDIDSKTNPILADPTQIHQIIMNLCTNAYHAMEETGGRLSLSLRNKALTGQDLVSVPDVQPGHFVQLSIRDTGSGITREIQKKIFEPYFTTKEAGKGTGMGLAIVHGIVKDYGGFITCQSEIGVGTVFEICLPSFLEQIVPETKHFNLIPVGTERILFIDDEEILAKMGQTMLERLGYSVTTKMSSIEALTTFKNQPDTFDLVITDQTMPGMTGVNLARSMLQIRPDLPIILCTGYSSQVSKEKAESYGIKGFAMKPLARKDISTLIRKVLDEMNRR